MHSTTRADFLADLRPTTGKYSGIIGVYRHPSSTNAIGVFDREIIAALAPTVKWIAHNGSGYDQIDIEACKEHGQTLCTFPSATLSDPIQAFAFRTPRKQ